MLNESGQFPIKKSSYILHRSHLLVRSVTPRDTGTYRCDSDLTGEASVEVYVVAPEDLMKSLHLHGALDQTDLRKTFRSNSEEVKGLTPSNAYSSFTSRVDGHGSNAFYDHPTKSHSEDYKNYKKNQSNYVQNIWKMSPSATSSACLNLNLVSTLVVISSMIIMIFGCL